MVINVTDKIVDYAGKNMMDSQGVEYTLRDAIIQALNNFGAEENLSPDDKYRIYKMSLEIYSNDVVTLNIEDAAFILERSGIVLNPIVYGQIKEALGG